MGELIIQHTQPDVMEEAKIAPLNLLPEKSRRLYIAAYDKFIEWQNSKQTSSFSENIMLAYFSSLSQKYKASSLWAQYSMLKSTLITNNNIDIRSYSKLIAFLKKQSVGFKSKKSKVLTTQDIEKYLKEAPDQKHLATKVALIFGVMGACRREELSQIKIQDIKEFESTYLVNVPVTKTHVARSFKITDDFYNVVKKYQLLRPLNCKCDRFFLNYHLGKCTQQPIGINKFGNMPKEIASYLHLENPASYTGHSFRRTSATLLAEAGADITTLKRHGGWKSNQVAEGYVEQSISNKNKICSQIGQSISLNIQENTEASSNVKQNTNTSLNIIKEPPTKILKTSENKIDILCEAKSPSIDDSAITEQNIDLSSKINIPHKNFNLTINNCANVAIHFHEK